MNNAVDFKDIILEQTKKTEEKWTGSCLDYLYLIKDDPSIAQISSSRVYNRILRDGVHDVGEELKTRGYEDLARYGFFEDKIFGTLEPIHDIMRFLKAAARRTETGRRILMLVGPVGSGKSSIASLIKRGLENDPTKIYAIDGCPIREEPLNLIPEEHRAYWEKELGVKIDGSLCPVCQAKYDEGLVSWSETPVVEMKFSEKQRSGIGTFLPSDPKSQDVSELIGRVNTSMMARYGETDPRAFMFNGELQVGNRGIVEMIELLKTDVKIQYVLIPAAQEQMIKAPGFPQMYIDTLILSHTNQTEFETFKSDAKNEALHDRIYTVMVPWNLRVDDEIKIYEKMIAESEFRGIHIAPNTLKVAAQFAVLSRLVPSTKVSSPIEKMMLYNGEISDDIKKQEVDVRTLMQEGRDKGEGMKGVSPRFIINALNVALGAKEDKKCVNPIDIIRALLANFNHQIGISEEDKAKLITLLRGEKGSVSSEYKEIALKEVNIAFLHAYEEQAQTLFSNYIQNATAYCSKEKICDSITGEYFSPDEKLMRSIEEYIGVPVNSKDEFRNGIFVHKSKCLENNEPFDFKSYSPLKRAIEKKLMSDLKNVVSRTIADRSSTDAKLNQKRSDAIDRLIENGYCKECAEVLLKFVGEILRKES